MMRKLHVFLLVVAALGFGFYLGGSYATGIAEREIAEVRAVADQEIARVKAEAEKARSTTLVSEFYRGVYGECLILLSNMYGAPRDHPSLVEKCTGVVVSAMKVEGHKFTFPGWPIGPKEQAYAH